MLKVGGGGASILIWPRRRLVRRGVKGLPRKITKRTRGRRARRGGERRERVLVFLRPGRRVRKK